MRLQREALENFFAGRFHQDWDLDAPTWQAAVMGFAVEQPGSVDAVLVGIANLLETASDAELPAILTVELGSCWEPIAEGLSAREWLLGIVAILEGTLSRSA